MSEYTNIRQNRPPPILYRLNAVSIKIATGFLAQFDKPILKFIWKLKGLRNTLEREEKIWKTQIPDAKSYYKATVIKTIRH